MTTAIAGVPPVTLPGRTIKSIGAGAPGGPTLIVPVPPTPLIVPTRLIVATSDTVEVVIGNDAESAPAGMLTRSGTVTGTGSARVRSSPCERSWWAVSFATSPPAGAGS